MSEAIPQPGGAALPHQMGHRRAAAALVGIPWRVGEVGLNGEFDRFRPSRGGYRFGDWLPSWLPMSRPNRCSVRTDSHIPITSVGIPIRRYVRCLWLSPIATAHVL
jgi:hypothetical protein